MNDLRLQLQQSDECIYSLSYFDYDRLDTETRTLVQSCATEIKTLMKQTAQNTVAIGQKLQEVKQCLGHGHFGKWLAAEFEWTVRTAQQLMTVAETFKYENFSHLNFAPSALYLLAAPSTPDAARSIALERAAQGDRITHKVAKQIITEAKHIGKGGVLKKLSPNKQDVPRESGEPVPASKREPSTCYWKKDREQERHLQIDLYDQEAGMKLESLAKNHEKSPQAIVILGIDALEALPEKEREVRELIIKQQDSESEIAMLFSRVAELDQTLVQKDLRLAELLQALAQKDSKEAELELSILALKSKLVDLEQTSVTVVSYMNDSREAELVQALSQKDSQLEEMKEQLAASEYYSTQAASELEQLKKELAQAKQLLEQQQQPKTLPSGKPHPIPRTEATPAPNLKSLIDFFDTAAEKLQKPSIQISMNGKTIVVSRNSTQHPGALNIKADGAWQGRINRDGSLYKIWEWENWIMPMLLAFAANPTEMAAIHGRSTGSCCFCNRALKDERSLATGYGAICAQHYGLQWPLETKLSQDVEQKYQCG